MIATESTMRDKILNAVYAGIHQLNRQNPSATPIQKSWHAPLYGSASDLDSLGLINLVVAVEQKVEQHLCVSITLVNDQALSQEVSPFSTVETLVLYIESLVRGQKNV